MTIDYENKPRIRQQHPSGNFGVGKLSGAKSNVRSDTWRMFIVYQSAHFGRFRGSQGTFLLVFVEI